MKRLSLVLMGLALLAMPLSASQFKQLSFDEVAREATYVVRGTVEQTWSKWDDSHEVIYTYATVRVHRYFGESAGPDTLVVREVGGLVDGYMQQAIGFPELRRGESVVFFLSPVEEGGAFRIHAYNQGKYLVVNRGGVETLIEDPFKQGEGRPERADRGPRANALDAALDSAPGITLDEFAGMVEAARAGETLGVADMK